MPNKILLFTTGFTSFTAPKSSERSEPALCPARELVADRDKPAAGSVRAREISPALRALLMAKKPQCPSVFRLCEYSSLHVLLSDCCF